MDYPLIVFDIATYPRDTRFRRMDRIPMSNMQYLESAYPYGCTN